MTDPMTARPASPTPQEGTAGLTPSPFKPTPQACNCFAEVNAKLAPSNGVIETNLFGTPGAVILICVTKKDAKVRKKPPRLIASFCPFCGVKKDLGHD